MPQYLKGISGKGKVECSIEPINKKSLDKSNAFQIMLGVTFSAHKNI
jgi:hypothetical protein